MNLIKLAGLLCSFYIHGGPPQILITNNLVEKQSPVATSKSNVLYIITNTAIRVNYDQAPLSVVLKDLSSQLNIIIAPQWEPHNNFNGLNPDAPISLYKESLVSVYDIIEEISCQLSDFTRQDCTWQLRDGGALEFGTKELLSVSRKQRVRIYDVNDVIFEPTHFTDSPQLDLNKALKQSYGVGGGQLAKSGTLFEQPPKQQIKPPNPNDLVLLIEETIESGNWKSQGGDWASISIYQDYLIVKAPDFIHRQINGYKELYNGPEYFKHNQKPDTVK